MTKPANLLILGGTRNARDLAILLNPHKHINVLTSLAGRTQEPDRSFGQIRIGGFGGVAGMAQFLRQNDINLLVDSTHPFATRISQNAVEACELTGVERIVLDRPQWEKQPGDNWIDCKNLEEAVDKIPAGTVAFLALGHQYLDTFSHRNDIRFIARMIDKPSTDIPLANLELVIAKPSHVAAEEEELFTRHNVRHLVCRNSGGTLIYAKIEAARNLKIPIFMIKRPPPPNGNCIDNIGDIAALIIRSFA